MSYLVLLIILVVAGFLIWRWAWAVRASGERDPLIPAGLLTWAARLVFLTTALIVLGWSIKIVPPGQVAVPVFFGNIVEPTLPEGFHIVNPLYSYAAYDTRRRAVTLSSGGDEGEAPALASDGVRLSRVDATMPLRLNAWAASRIHARVGGNYSERMVVPAARSAIRQAVSEFPAIAVATSARAEVEARATALFAERLAIELSQNGFDASEAETVFVVMPAQLRRVELPDRILQANAERQAAEVDLERQEVLTRIAEQEAIRRGNEGQGVRNLIQSLGLNETPSPEQISTVLYAMAAKTRADAQVRAVEDGLVSVMVMDGQNAAVTAR